MGILNCTIMFLALFCLGLGVFTGFNLSNQMQNFKLAERKTYLKATDELESEDLDEDVMFHKFRNSYSTEDKIIEMSKMMKYINEKQRVRNARKLGLEDTKFETVIVVRIRNNIKHLAVLLDSLRHVKFITKSLLICAHDFYDIKINMLLKRMPFVRVLQIFYPYSTQIYPDLYPGRDARFCQTLHTCITSNQRNDTLAQSKLFWWWVTSQVFDQIEVLQRYDGYIYFLETEQYLTSDFIDMAKMLEKLQTLFCPDCRILSLASRPPKLELYNKNNNALVVDVWNTNSSKEVIGFNRRTWYEMKFKKLEFCHFNDSSWDRSLIHLVSTTQEKKFQMLSPRAPRAFSTKGCGMFRNGTDCSLDSIYSDILNFLNKVREELFPENFKLKPGYTEADAAIEERGGWEDARDREFCMYIASRGKPAKTTQM